MSSAQKLLIDGVRIVMQVLVDEFGDRMTRDTREDIQQWYDRCYEMLGEGQHEQVSDRTCNDSRAHEFGQRLVRADAVGLGSPQNPPARPPAPAKKSGADCLQSRFAISWILSLCRPLFAPARET